MKNKHSRVEYGIVVEHEDTVAFHPGYYIMEIISDSGLTREDFAKRLNTTPKNLSVLVRGKERLSVDMATKLSNMLGTSTEYWLNLQSAYDTAIAEIEAEEELAEEIAALKEIGYSYFREHCGLPALPRQLKEQVAELRRLLGVSSLNVLRKANLTTSFRSAMESMDESGVIKTNALVQLAVRKAGQTNAPRYNRAKFCEAIEYALIQTSDHSDFLGRVEDAFLEAGVILVVLPNLKGSKTNGATKKIGNSIMLMVSDRQKYADSFWFTLLHEAGHIINGDMGLSLQSEHGQQEDAADQFARDALIPPEAYKAFTNQVKHGATLDVRLICDFAEQINRDPGLVVGRLMNDGIISYSNTELGSLRMKYRVV